jgi:hypothetical protein
LPRSYTVRSVALALSTSGKWIDNLLSRHALPGVERGRQGVERRVSDDGLLAIEFTRMLNLELGVSMERAAEIAREAMSSRNPGGMTFATSSGLSLHFPVADIERRLRERMMDALEAAAHRRRGRPPRSTRT